MAEESKDHELAPKGLVHVEQTDLVAPVPPKHDYVLENYAERRGRWGALFGASYTNFVPVNYEPNFVSANFGDVYGAAKLPLVEGQMIIKRNLSFGSLGLEIAAGSYDNKSRSSDVASDLNLISMRLGVVFVADMLFKNPYVAPYASLGVYSFFFREKLAGNSYNGHTQVAPYVTLGAQFQLDWIDSDSKRTAFETGGLQNTFLFAELRKYFASADRTDPNFETDLNLGGGLRLEF